jgi:regulator of ribosome biosynthesis
VARKARVTKNEGQRLQNLARAQQGVAVNSDTHAEHKKKEIERSLVTTRASTASMGRFDRMLPGEKKPRGLKRKVTVIHLLFFLLRSLTLHCDQFDPIEQSVEAEKSANLALIKKLGSDHSSMKKPRQDTGDGDRNRNVLNVRKAVRFASNGQGAAALASKSGSEVKKQRGKR